jgi:hypothetical protein
MRAARRFVPGLVLGVLAGLTLATGAVDAATRLVRVPADTPGLASLGLALDHATRAGDEVVYAASEWDVAQLEAAGIRYEVEIADLESFYAARLGAERAQWGDADPGDTPGFGFGSMGGYYTWSEVVAKLDEMRADYPALITAKQSLGLSHEGRDIWQVKISDQPDLAEGEPAILYTALTHAREPEGMMVLLYYMFYLLENYGTDPEATYLVNEREMYFVPVLNPDGYERNRTTNPGGGGMWRKNRRVNGGGTYGVDLNRNYGYNWGYDNQGSSPTPSSDTYRGPAPFSEPETSALRVFHQGRAITTAFHYHTYGNYEIHPFGYAQNTFPPEPDYSLYQYYGFEIAAMNGFLVGSAWQTVNYATNGDAVDWSYGEQNEKNKVFAFTPEVGTQSDGFWPPTTRIVPLAELNRGPNLYWAWIAGSRAVLAAVLAPATVPAGTTAQVTTEVANYGLGAAATDVTVALATSDPYVTIAVPEKPFPAIPSLEVGSNAGDPLEFFVLPGAPPNHVIALELTLKQGGLVRAVHPFQATVQASAGLEPAAAPGLDRLSVRATPNPLVLGTEFQLTLPAAGAAEISVVDVAGRVRRTLATGVLAAGEQRVGFDGRDARGEALPSGVYLVRVALGAERAETRLLILR